MPQTILRFPELLQILKDGHLRMGANQEWYPQLWQRQAGCGPTNCAHLLWYLSQTRPGCRALVEYDCREAEDFLRLMEEVWHYVTPGKMGVNSTAIFTGGALRYARERGVTLQPRVLEIPALPFARPKAEVLAEYLCAALSDDLPVAFLNLANGALGNLDSWHWVTLVACDPAKLTVTMYNQGNSSELNLGLWLRSTTLGGGLVTLSESLTPAGV